MCKFSNFLTDDNPLSPYLSLTDTPLLVRTATFQLLGPSTTKMVSGTERVLSRSLHLPKPTGKVRNGASVIVFRSVQHTSSTWWMPLGVLIITCGKYTIRVQVRKRKTQAWWTASHTPRLAFSIIERSAFSLSALEQTNPSEETSGKEWLSLP